MYYYIYDSFTREPKYAEVLNKINMALADLDIAGEEARVTPIRKIKDLVEEGIKKGHKNIIACGNDSTAQKIVSALAGLKVSKKDICFGIIPVEPSEVAQVLGVLSYEEAIKIISKRRIEKVDLGKINNQYFLVSCNTGTDKSSARLSSFWCKLSFITRSIRYPEIQLKFKEGYRVTTQPTRVGIFNILDYDKGKISLKTNNQISVAVSPQDGLLDVIIVGKLSRFNFFKYLRDIQQNNFERIPGISLFRTKKVSISSSSSITVTADRQGIKANSFTCEIVPKKLNVIVGKERKF